jgi:hypothetical protein
MTLTHVIPSLRRTVPDPLTRDLWPEFVTTSTTDVTIAGVSLLRLVDWCGTPCVHTAAAVVPGTGGRPSETELASVVVTRVRAVDRNGDDSLDVWIDAEAGNCGAVLSEARLIGRASTAHDSDARLRSTTGEYAIQGTIEIGDDVRAGDLLAIPCRGATRLHEVSPLHQGCPAGADTSRSDPERDDSAPLPACGK